VNADPATGLRLIRKGTLAETPAGHWDMRAHLLVDQEAVRVQYCEMEGGGGAEPHVHEHADQILIIVDGSLSVGASEVDQGITAGEGDAVYVPSGAPHATRPVEASPVRYVVVTLPPS
jgi:mannose-6-phosphate isomerase-like protein (cupin superfamily)